VDLRVAVVTAIKVTAMQTATWNPIDRIIQNQPPTVLIPSFCFYLLFDRVGKFSGGMNGINLGIPDASLPVHLLNDDLCLSESGSDDD